MYHSVSELPIQLKNLMPLELHKDYIKRFNAAFTQGMAAGQDEAQCKKVAARTAWAAVNQKCMKTSV